MRLHHPGRSRAARIPLYLVGVVLVALLTGACLPLVDPPTSGRNFGYGPLQAVSDAATAKASCGLTPVQLAAMMMAPTYTEAGGPVPGPMALSRWDNLSVNSSNANLFAFGKTSGAYVNAFFSPGIGMWQFDSAGGWPFSAAGAIDSVTASNQAAATISYRWCNAPDAQKGTPEARRKYAWGPWYGCSTTETCETIYKSLDAGDKLNTAYDTSVTRYGGMQQRTCNLDGVGTGLTCWYVNPALAEGSKGWTGGTYNGTTTGVTPLPKPFYVVEAGGKEYRVWLPEDTGYDIGITASKPVTANARTSLTWSRSASLCDVTASRGLCGGGASPVGRMDAATPVGTSQVRVVGWALDPDTTSSIAVHVYVDGVGTATTANVARPDIAAAYPGYGELHGYDVTVSAGLGTHQVCSYAINVFGGSTTVLGCTTVTNSGTPRGALDATVVGPGWVALSGWVSVPGDDAAQAVVYLDGVEAGRFDTTVARPDVAAAVAGAGPTAGFQGAIAAAGGAHRLCLSAPGSAPTALGCRTVTNPTGSPNGALDVVSTGIGTVSVAGWAVDPDTSAPIPVHVYVGGVGTALVADQYRSDVAAAFPLYGGEHGFWATLPANGGVVNVCAYGINSGGGTNVLLGCRTVTVPAGSPFGSLDVVERSGGAIQVAGWAIDPDTWAPIQVHVYVGAAGSALTADQPRPDVAAAVPGYGPDHGFSASLPDPGGRQTVCAYGINAAGSGSNRLLGCRTL